jgi:uncharacterized BrkB/YihY/UPF0761 family membrane protein
LLCLILISIKNMLSRGRLGKGAQIGAVGMVLVFGLWLFLGWMIGL